MFVNIIKSYRDVVAICDSDLLNKNFEEGDFKIEVKENFYKGKKLEEEEVLEIIKKMYREDATFNIVGKKSISVAIKGKIISEEDVKTINGVPYALVLI